MITRVKDLCYHSVHQPYSLKPVRTHGSLLFEFSPALQISPCSSNFPCSSKISNLCSSSKCWPDSFESVSAYLVQSRVPCMYPVLILRTTTMPCLCLCNLFTLFHVHRKAAHSNGCAAVTHTHTHTHTNTHTHCHSPACFVRLFVPRAPLGCRPPLLLDLRVRLLLLPPRAPVCVHCLEGSLLLCMLLWVPLWVLL
jgi:hypothetical protein